MNDAFHDGDGGGAGRRAPPGRRQKGPFVDQCEPGKYAWCCCGRSATYPYCDGSHRGSDVSPIKVTFSEPRTVVWCACGASNNKPFCDGSHCRL
jgi:CDGSH-type Zn-finger protein